MRDHSTNLNVDAHKVNSISILNNQSIWLDIWQSQNTREKIVLILESCIGDPVSMGMFVS